MQSTAFGSQFTESLHKGFTDLGRHRFVDRTPPDILLRAFFFDNSLIER